jgi:hypothetical protein
MKGWLEDKSNKNKWGVAIIYRYTLTPFKKALLPNIPPPNPNVPIGIISNQQNEP